jgi:hypothetical protein
MKKEKEYHGMWGTPEYKAWENLRNRCRNPNNPKYEYYGGRGVTWHPLFDSFSEFFKEVGLRPSSGHSIDRYPNNNGNYEPGNLRWATIEQQNLNLRVQKRKSSKFRGIYWVKDRNKWQAQIRFNGEKAKNLGRFENELDAVEVYLENYYGHYKKFPPEYIPAKLSFKKGLI